MSDVTTKSTTKTADSIVTRDDGDTKLIKVPISSTRPDRDGDEFAEEALTGMQKQIRREKPLIFQNHGFTGITDPLYDQSETIGTLADAEIQGDKDADGEDRDLVGLINPDGTHPEGERMLAQVEDGQAIKFSVGFRVLEADAKDPESDNDERRVFKDVDLMETSKVGIPANPDATAEVAAKAAGLTEQLSAAGLDIEDEEAFASALASELVSASGPVTAEDVRHATPTAYDGEPEQGTRTLDVGLLPQGTATDDLSLSRRDVLDLMSRNADAEGKGACDEDGDCPDGETCVDGECVDEEDAETDDYLMTDDAKERLNDLETKVESLHDAVTSVLGELESAKGELDTDDHDEAKTDDQLDETFSVDVDGEEKEYTPEDIRELEAAADEADVDEAKTRDRPGEDDTVLDADGEPVDDDGDGSDAKAADEADDRQRSAEEILY